MTAEEIKAAGGGRVDRAKVAATTAEDIRRHMVEDGEDPNAPLADYRPRPDLRAIRRRLGMSEEAFASAIGMTVPTVREWERHGSRLDPAARVLLRILEREPEAALRALVG